MTHDGTEAAGASDKQHEEEEEFKEEEPITTIDVETGKKFKSKNGAKPRNGTLWRTKSSHEKLTYH
jgi:hypothetical protein